MQIKTDKYIRNVKKSNIESYFIWTIFFRTFFIVLVGILYSRFVFCFFVWILLFQLGKFFMVSEMDNVFYGRDCNKYVHNDRTTNAWL